MSIQLLKHLNGNKNGGLKKFIDRFEGKGEPRICWYPSAGEDFRALLYLHVNYSEMSPAMKDDPASPDIFLFTDYFPWKYSGFLDTKIIFSDERTNIIVDVMEELPRLNTSLHHDIVDFPEGSNATGRALFLTIRVDSSKLGQFSFPVIYAFAENESFCAEVLLPDKAMLSHIIHIRYGGGCCGGGKASGVWMLNVLKRLGCELFITDGHYCWQRGDESAKRFYPVLGGNETEPVLECIRTVKSSNWSGHGDVTWNRVL